MFMILNEVKLFAIGPLTKALSPMVNGGSMESHGCYLKWKVAKVRIVEWLETQRNPFSNHLWKVWYDGIGSNNLLFRKVERL
jgi:hypothetical protein